MSTPAQALDRRNNPVPNALKPGTTQKVAYTGTAGTIANAVSSNVVRVVCTTDAFIAVGAAPTATTAGMPVFANTPITLGVIDGVDKVSAIQSASGGDLYVTNMV